MTPAPPVSSAPTQRLTLAETVRLARQHVPAVLEAMSLVAGSRAQARLAGATLLPSINARFEGHGYREDGPSLVAAFIPGAGAIATQSQYFLDSTIAGRWTIWDFGRTSLSVQAAQWTVRGAGENVRVAELVAVAHAAGAFFAVLTDQQMVQSFSQTLAMRRQELSIASGLVDAGVREPIERLRALLSVNNAELDVTNAEVSRQGDMVSFAAALGIDPAVEAFEVVEPQSLRVDEQPSRAADAALAARPEIALARARVNRAEAQLAAVRASYRPSVFVSGTVAAGYAVIVDPNLVSGPRLALTANAGVSVPLFDPTLSPQVAIALADVQTARASLATQSLSVRAEAAQSALLVRGARQQLAQSEQIAATAAANLAASQGRYAAGVGSLLQLVDAQGADATARIALVRARLQLEASKVRLLAVIGQLDMLATAP